MFKDHQAFRVLVLIEKDGYVKEVRQLLWGLDTRARRHANHEIEWHICSRMHMAAMLETNKLIPFHSVLSSSQLKENNKLL